MTACDNKLWKSLSTEMKHEVAALTAAWQSCRARRIEAGMPASSPDVFDDKDGPTMETGSDDTASELAPVHASFTMEQAHAHFNNLRRGLCLCSNTRRRNNSTTCPFSRNTG
ncbi:NHL repeat-containing protein 2 [Hordeum vulgare]|nr:NHL repeat-containing protein 2 [Hordeum vulgare]